MKRIARRLAIAAGLAMAASLLWARRIDVGSDSSPVAMVPVVTANKDVGSGQIFNGTELTVTSWPAGTVPAGAFEHVDSVLGRAARVAVYRGEAILPGSLALTGVPRGFDVPVVPGHRAYGVRVDDVATLAGLIRPNSRVDIMVVTRHRSGSRPVAKLLLANVRVIAIDTPRDGASARPAGGVAVLEVTPDQATMLAVAQARGSLQFVLRGKGDRESASLVGETRGQIASRAR